MMQTGYAIGMIWFCTINCAFNFGNQENFSLFTAGQTMERL